MIGETNVPGRRRISSYSVDDDYDEYPISIVVEGNDDISTFVDSTNASSNSDDINDEHQQQLEHQQEHNPCNLPQHVPLHSNPNENYSGYIQSYNYVNYGNYDVPKEAHNDPDEEAVENYHEGEKNSNSSTISSSSRNSSQRSRYRKAVWSLVPSLKCLTMTVFVMFVVILMSKSAA